MTLELKDFVGKGITVASGNVRKFFAKADAHLAVQILYCHPGEVSATALGVHTLA
jgi:hypothetical protein